MGSLRPTDSQMTVSVPAKDAVLAAIRQRAAERDLPLGRAAVTLIEDAMNGAPASALVNLEAVSTDDIIDELVGRLQQLPEIDALRTRAETAEAKLFTVASAIGATIAG